MNENSFWYKFKSFLGECIRVIRVIKKPDRIEFTTIVKASGLGMVIIGVIGFVIQMIRHLVLP